MKFIVLFRFSISLVAASLLLPASVFAGRLSDNGSLEIHLFYEETNRDFLLSEWLKLGGVEDDEVLAVMRDDDRSAGKEWAELELALGTSNSDVVGKRLLCAAALVAAAESAEEDVSVAEVLMNHEVRLSSGDNVGVNWANRLRSILAADEMPLNRLEYPLAVELLLESSSGEVSAAQMASMTDVFQQMREGGLEIGYHDFRYILIRYLQGLQSTEFLESIWQEGFIDEASIKESRLLLVSTLALFSEPIFEGWVVDKLRKERDTFRDGDDFQLRARALRYLEARQTSPIIRRFILETLSVFPGSFYSDLPVLADILSNSGPHTGEVEQIEALELRFSTITKKLNEASKREPAF